jgi:hypothetical protein
MEVHHSGRAEFAADESPTMLVVLGELIVVLTEEVTVLLALFGV